MLAAIAVSTYVRLEDGRLMCFFFGVKKNRLLGGKGFSVSDSSKKDYLVRNISHCSSLSYRAPISGISKDHLDLLHHADFRL